MLYLCVVITIELSQTFVETLRKFHCNLDTCIHSLLTIFQSCIKNVQKYECFILKSKDIYLNDTDEQVTIEKGTYIKFNYFF